MTSPKKTNRLFNLAAAAVALLTATGCASNLEGNWESEERINGKYNTMYIDADGTGEATLRFSLGSKNYFADFSIEWEETDDGYEIDMECEGNCSDLDFTMTCKERNDGATLKCKGDGKWSEYGFKWSKDE